MNINHVCLAGDKCRGRHRAEDKQGWVPAPTECPDTLCRSCILAVEGSVSELWSDYLALMRGIGESATQSSANIRRPQPSSRPTINVHRLALMSEIATTVDRSAEQVADKLNMANPEHAREISRLAAGLAIIEANIPTLVMVGIIDCHSWAENGTYWGADETSGPDLAWRLVDLHHRTQSHLGLTRGRDRMPVPCPRCSADALGRWHGGSKVDCLECGRDWSEEQYQQFCIITVKMQQRKESA